MSCENTNCGKKAFHEGITQVTCKLQHGGMHGHACKNEIIEQYCG